VTPLSRPFWDATREARLVIPRCTTCGQFCWLPQLACPRCRTETLEWTDVSGRAEVYSYVTVHTSMTPGIEAPYTVAVVTLEEGPRFFTNIVDVDPAEVRIGMPVRVKFEDAGPVSLPRFAPR